MTLLLNKHVSADDPAVHVLVVVVGDYPYLKNGSSEASFSNHAGMGQLSSPPISARKVVEWFEKDFRPYNAKLATIDVLCSGTQLFRNEAGVEQEVASATLSNVSEAVQSWFARGQRDPRDTLIFYFCGHSVTSGAITTLLLEDFGSNPLDPFSSGAVDADGFITGMRKCTSLNQLYMLDTCRCSPLEYIDEFGEFRGAPLVRAALHANLGKSQQTVIWASELGRGAYARKGKPTVFLEAWLSAMKGAGARRDENTYDWVIQGNALTEGINEFIKRAVGAKKQFASPGTMTAGFPIHVLEGLPVVPVNVVCRPAESYQGVELSCNPGAFKAQGLTGPWHLELKHGVYKIVANASASGSVLDQQDCLVAPPVALVAMNLGM